MTILTRAIEWVKARYVEPTTRWCAVAALTQGAVALISGADLVVIIIAFLSPVVGIICPEARPIVAAVDAAKGLSEPKYPTGE